MAVSHRFTVQAMIYFHGMTKINIFFSFQVCTDPSTVSETDYLYIAVNNTLTNDKERSMEKTVIAGVSI